MTFEAKRCVRYTDPIRFWAFPLKRGQLCLWNTKQFTTKKYNMKTVALFTHKMFLNSKNKQLFDLDKYLLWR